MWALLHLALYAQLGRTLAQVKAREPVQTAPSDSTMMTTIPQPRAWPAPLDSRLLLPGPTAPQDALGACLVRRRPPLAAVIALCNATAIDDAKIGGEQYTHFDETENLIALADRLCILTKTFTGVQAKTGSSRMGG